MPNLLPDMECNLQDLKKAKSAAFPVGNAVGNRNDMQWHWERLQDTFAGKSHLFALHGLAISYLRRETPHTAHAWIVFERIWEEEPKFLRHGLPTRWLVSALQTFFDHSHDPEDRTCGGVGFMYANMIKIYECERNSEARNTPDIVQRYNLPNFPSMYGFAPGNDIVLNINKLAYDAAEQSELAGPILRELLERAKQADIIFQRMDLAGEKRTAKEGGTVKYAFGEACVRDE